MRALPLNRHRIAAHLVTYSTDVAELPVPINLVKAFELNGIHIVADILNYTPEELVKNSQALYDRTRAGGLLASDRNEERMCRIRPERLEQLKEVFAEARIRWEKAEPGYVPAGKAETGGIEAGRERPEDHPPVEIYQPNGAVVMRVLRDEGEYGRRIKQERRLPEGPKRVWEK